MKHTVTLIAAISFSLLTTLHFAEAAKPIGVRELFAAPQADTPCGQSLRPQANSQIAAASSVDQMSQAHHVRSAEEIESLIKSRRLTPGATIIWADGTFKDVELNVAGVDGTNAQPITLRAATPGGVILRGESQFTVGAQWWVIQGFHFDGVATEVNSYNTFQFRSRGGRPAQHVRLTDCAMTNLRTDEDTSKWLLVYGSFNAIDHCHFSGKNSKGALLTVELGDLKGDATVEHRIEWNYFGDIAPQAGTDNETIRIGFSGDQNKQAKCLVRRNLFVRCNGENEIISNKSSFNTYEANTFRQCDGALVLRHGHHARVEGNFFFGDGAQNAGGIRVSDSQHVIANNYLQDLTGTTWNAALSILGGKEPSGGNGNGYQAVDEITVIHNSIVNCKRSIFLNQAKGSRPPTGVMANNLVSSSTGPLITEGLSAAKLKWIGNLLHGAPVGAAVDVSTSDPQLRVIDGLLRPHASGPAANAAIKHQIHVRLDIDGQQRVDFEADIGADEVAGAIGIMSSAPLNPADVGVSFLRGNGPNRP